MMEAHGQKSTAVIDHFMLPWLRHVALGDLVQKAEENYSFIKATQFPLQEYQLISLVKYEHMHVCVCLCVLV